MSNTILKNVRIVNEGKIIEGDLHIKGNRIEKIGGTIANLGATEVDGKGRLVIPGIVDDQVHFREPGLTYKANIHSESGAAAAGGVTTFMEMPNTKPAALTQELLQNKYDIAAETSYTNYSFFMGCSNENIEEVLKTDRKNICGVKVFMGSSTGKMLVDDATALKNIFSRVDLLIATHCEDEQTIKSNLEWYKNKFGDKIDAREHPYIRSEEGCYLSSSKAIELAKRYDSRLHILHISTSKELDLFRNDIPLKEKRITSEVCVHHLHFDARNYLTLGNQVKCNPAVKDAYHKEALFKALLDDRLDIIATDHAPHTWEEKSKPYLEAPSGVPLVQHTLNVMLEFYHQGKISLEKIVEKMCHAPATCFDLAERGFIREGYFADLVIVDENKEWEVNKNNLFYKCNWSPFEGRKFKGSIDQTYVNGNLVYKSGKLGTHGQGMRVTFDR